MPTTDAEVACAHCALPVPPGLIEPGDTEQFCCAGCRAAYEIINSCGLERFYAMRTDDEAEPARGSGRGYEEFDDGTFRELYTRPLDNGLTRTELILEGVHCSACVWLVEKLPTIEPGVVEARLDLTRATVTLTWNDGQASLAQLARALDRLGYVPHPARGVKARQIRQREDRAWMIRLAVSGALAGNGMLLAIALYGGMLQGISDEHERLFRYFSAGLGLTAVLWPGRVFFRGAITAIRARTWRLDLPIAIGLACGTGAGLVNTVLDTGEIYFDSLIILIFLLLVGRFLQRRQQAAAADSVELLYTLTPNTARMVDGDDIRETPIEALMPGFIVEVLAGDSIPVDGVITTGATTIDTSILTGESRPSPAEVGQPVAAGTVNLGSTIRVRADAVGAETRLGGLMHTIESLSSYTKPTINAEDRIAGYFVITVLSLAALTAVFWVRVSTAEAVNNAITLLIITCPCALGLATPLAATVAIGRAARQGILIKGGHILERLARPARVVLDKTGTVTEGVYTVVSWTGDESLRPLVAALERHSTHPVAAALAAQGDDAEHVLSGVQYHPGRGIEGVVDGRQLFAGAPAAVRERFGEPPGMIADAEHQAATRGLTPVVVAEGVRIVAVAALGDPVRPDSADAIAALQRRGYETTLLSGDDPPVVESVAKAVGIDDALGAQTPEDKLVYIESLDGPTVMVGDGVNDAAALARADIGVAVHGGAEASLAAADVYLQKPGLVPLNELFEGGRRTVRTIRLALAVSLCYNVVGAGLAMSGLINPLIGAILMPISSLTVLAIAVRARTFGDRR